MGILFSSHRDLPRPITSDETSTRPSIEGHGDLHGGGVNSAPERFRYFDSFSSYVSVVDQMAAVFRRSEVSRAAASVRGVEIVEDSLQGLCRMCDRDGGSAIPWMSRGALRHSQCVHDGHRSLYSEPSCDRVLPSLGSPQRARSRASRKGHRLYRHFDELVQWIAANMAKEVPVNRKPSSDDLIAYHLQNAREPKAFSKMAQPWKASAPHRPGPD